MKICPKCEKPGVFSIDRSRADGLGYQCKACNSRYKKEKKFQRPPRTAEQKKVHRESMDAWRKAHPGHLKAKRALNRPYYLLSVSRSIAKRLGYAPIAVADVAELAAWMDKQPKYCRVCKKVPKRLCIDHCHTTGRLRGMLCNFCNARVVGLVEKYPHLLLEAQAYLSEQAAVVL